MHVNRSKQQLSPYYQWQNNQAGKNLHLLRTAFEKNQIILTSKRTPYSTKAHFYDTFILPVILSGLECVNWTSKLIDTVETFQNHMMRFMTGNRLRDRVPINTLLEKTTLTHLTPIIKRKVLKLYGHLKRSKYALRVWLRERGTEVDHINGGVTMSIFDQWRVLSHVNAHSSLSGDSVT